MSEPIQFGNISRLMPESSAVQRAKKAAGTGKPDELQKVCRDFESIFIQQMMQQMRQTVPQNGLFSGGRAEQIYTSMLDGEMSKNFAQERGMGLSEVMYRQLSTLHYNAENEK